ncbi:MAG: F0F1 ATP synthase subunit B [Syntrophaceae bacterium]
MRDKFYQVMKKSQIILLPLAIILVAGIAYASSGGGEPIDHAKQMKDFGWRILNTAILVFFLYKMAWKKMKAFFVDRREAIKAQMDQSEAAKAEAEQKFKEYSDRLEKATGEITGIADMIKAQGVAEREKIIESAKKSSEKMKEDATARMDQEYKKASKRLRIEAAELSVLMAEDILKKSVKPQDHETMVKDFLERMVRQN